MKKIFLSSIICFLSISISSCSNTSTSNSLSSLSEEKFLIEGVDYVDHSSAYNGKKFIYNDSMWYINELVNVPLPDPHVFYEDGVYYITGTSDRSEGRVVDCYVTEDFVNYDLIELYNPARFNGWEADDPQIYAPEIYKFDNKYYMYYSAIDSYEYSTRRNSVLVANNPAGPYRPIQNGIVDGLNEPVFNFDMHRGLDVTIFEDDNGELYMYYVTTEDTQHIVGVKLKSPYEADWTTRKKIVIPGTIDSNSDKIVLDWECYREHETNIAEAPYMIKSNGKYYLTYSVNGCWNKYYSVCYAVSSSPLGNFVKPYEEGNTWTNLLFGYPGEKDEDGKVYNQWSGFASGTGHHCFFNIGEQVMIGYHAHQNRDYNEHDEGYTKRYFAFDYLHFDNNGVPFCNGPTYSLQPLPEELSGYRNISLESNVEVFNVTNKEVIKDKYIEDCYNLSSNINKEVILGSGLSYIELEFDKEYEIGGIAIYNSAFYDKAIYEIEYIDFGNDNIVYYAQFAKDAYVNDEKEFIYPCSAFTVEFPKVFKSNKVKICFNDMDGAQINEIIVLGK